MLRKMIIALAAAAAVAAASTFSAAAMHGGGGGMGHGGMSGGFGGHGFGHAAFGHPGGFRGFAGAHHFGLRGDRFAFRNRFVRHRFFHNRFAFIGAPFGYGYGYGYDNCYARVWTAWGWRWAPVCY